MNNLARQRARYWAKRSAAAMPGVTFTIQQGDYVCSYTVKDGVTFTTGRRNTQPYRSKELKHYG